MFKDGKRRRESIINEFDEAFMNLIDDKQIA